jgi:hypothetical protein
MTYFFFIEATLKVRGGFFYLVGLVENSTGLISCEPGDPIWHSGPGGSERR